MANQLKKKNSASGGLYIALAICILSVICIGVYSAIINIFETPVLESPIAEGVKNQKDTSKEKKEPSVTIEIPRATSTPIPPVTETPETTVGAAPKEPVEPEHNVNAQPAPPSYTMPVAGDISAAFSGEVLVYSETMNDYRVHSGVDLAATVGTPVKAFTDGVVCEVYSDPLMGQTVVLDHGENTKSIYQNLSTQLPDGIEVGVLVEEGQVIGGVGETVLIECAEAPHLHFAVTVDGKNVDPMEYFK